MKGKYTSWPKYVAAKLHRTIIQRRIAKLVTWEPLEEAAPGYTIVIGCNTPLAQMLGANLRMLERQRLDHLDRLIVVFDTPKCRMPFDVEGAVRQQCSQLPLEFLYYDDHQFRTARRLAHPWVYSWLSWCIGLAAARTRYCLLHDFDAMLIAPNIIEDRYEAIRRRGAQYCGVRNYLGNGIEETDGLAVTFEMMFDLVFVRTNFKPIELYNQVARHKGRTVEFDTFLYAQVKAGKSFVWEVSESDMVHPSQVICQFGQLMGWKGFVPPEANNLLMIPYFLDLAGRPQLMKETAGELRQAVLKGSREIAFFGRRMNLSRLSDTHVQWITKQAFRLDCAVGGAVRLEVAEYFASIGDFVQGKTS